MTNRKTSSKQKYEQEIEQIRVSNQEIIKEKFSKRKIDINMVCEKKDIHNILNSFLQEDIFEQDLLNEFWQYYFRKSAPISEIIRGYVNTTIILLDKIITNNNKITDLIRERQKYKQNHDYKNLNMSNIQLEQISVQTSQFNTDLNEMCKPFAFNFTNIVNKYRNDKLNISKSKVQESEKDQTIPNKESQQIKLQLINLLKLDAQLNPAQLQTQSQKDLTNEQKYYRFIIYILMMVFVVEVSMSFNKSNVVDLFATILLLLNSLLEDYYCRSDYVNQTLQNIELNTIQNKLSLKQDQAYMIGIIIQEKRVHSFQNYAYCLVIVLGLVILWDALWLLLMFDTYYYSQFALYPKFSAFGEYGPMWKYNRYVVFSSCFTIFAKIVMFLFTFQLTEIDPKRIFNALNVYFTFIRFSSFKFITELINAKHIQA